MRDEAIMSIVAISVFSGTVLLGMLLFTIRSIVRTHVLASLKARCVAAGMSAAEIEQVVLVGEKKCYSRTVNQVRVDNDAYPIEKAPPVVSSRAYAATR
jgi:hypothetical protein